MCGRPVAYRRSDPALRSFISSIARRLGRINRTGRTETKAAIPPRSRRSAARGRSIQIVLHVFPLLPLPCTERSLNLLRERDAVFVSLLRARVIQIGRKFVSDRTN